jgi:hypothetical protein
MQWVETATPSFRARHEDVDAGEAAQVLHSLERARERLAAYFPHAPDETTVVLHRSGMSLAMARPLVPLARLVTAPAARRYVAGWVDDEELHVLTPAALRTRAANVSGSREMLALTAPALYARRVISENNRDLPRRPLVRRSALELRWAWLLEGAARWFAGQTGHARPAIARRLREGAGPDFPPGLRDATLLGGTVIDLLAREEGEHAAAELTSRLHPQGARAALSGAFRGRSFAEVERAWRSHLARLAAAGGGARR